MNERLKILVCANFAEYFRKAAKEEFEDIDIVDYPSHCMLHKGDTNLLETVLGQTVAKAPEDVALLCGKLCPLRTVASQKEPRMEVLYSEICFSNIIGASFVKFLLEKGAYLVTHTWLLDWKRHIQEMGFDEETASRYYGEFTSEIVCISESKNDPVLTREIERFSDWLKIPASIIETDSHLIRLYLQRLHSEWKLRKSTKNTDDIDNYRKQSADYLTMFELIKHLSEKDKQSDVISSLKEALSMLFSCQSIDFLTVERESFDNNLSRLHKEFLRDRFAKNRMLDDGTGFLARVELAGKTLGVIEARHFSFPQFLRQYMIFTMNISSVLGLAISNVRKIEVIKKNEADLDFASSHDALTGLFNRRRFEKEIDILTDENYPGDLCLVMCDLDGLKLINDNLGHAQGDRAIRGTADILRSCFRETDLLARLGGDEFAGLIKDCDQDLIEVLKIRLASGMEHFNKENPDLEIGFSLGFSPVCSASDDLFLMLKAADDRMYEEKRKRKGLHK